MYWKDILLLHWKYLFSVIHWSTLFDVVFLLTKVCTKSVNININKVRSMYTFLLSYTLLLTYDNIHLNSKNCAFSMICIIKSVAICTFQSGDCKSTRPLMNTLQNTKHTQSVWSETGNMHETPFKIWISCSAFNK